MPKRGDTLYRIRCGCTSDPEAYVLGAYLEKALFIEEGLSSPGCTETTFLLQHLHKDGGKRFRCSKTMYVDTERKAWERYLNEVEAAIPEAEKSVLEAVHHYGYVRAERAKVLEILKGTP